MLKDFLNNFQAAQDTIREASAAAADAAKQNMKQAYEKATKISLNVDLNAPDIIVPVDSSSYHVLAIDLGHLSITNSFIVLEEKNKSGHPAVVDEMRLKLTNMTIHRAQYNLKLEEEQVCDILEPVTFVFTVRRNLSSSWYDAVPDITVTGNINSIKVAIREIRSIFTYYFFQLLLSQADYQMIMSILSGNLAEGTKPEPKSNKVTPVPSKLVSIPQMAIVEGESSISSYKATGERVHTFLKFIFTMESFIINLYTGAAKTVFLCLKCIKPICLS